MQTSLDAMQTSLDAFTALASAEDASGSGGGEGVEMRRRSNS